MRTYFKLLQHVELNGNAPDYKDVAQATTANGIYKAVEEFEDRGGLVDDLYIETFALTAGLPTDTDPCLNYQSYGEWLEDQEKAAA